jgi:hypothetical protein
MKKIYLIMSFLSLWFYTLTGQSQWDIQFAQSNIDCSINQICYELQVQNTAGANWTIGDQNYRSFFDGDLMTVTSVISLLPNTFYGEVNIDQNIKITGQGQEAASPLDDIDDNLGFLDFSIVQTDKSNPSAATQLTAGVYTSIAEICVTVNATIINSGGNDCLSFYHSRPSTSGNITNQYTVISENDAVGNTTVTVGVNYYDLTPANTNESCFNNFCGSNLGCTIFAHLRENNCCQACEFGNLQVMTLHWSEEYVNLSSANVALGKPSIINGTLNLTAGNAHQVTDGKFEGEPFANHDYAFSTAGTNNRWDIDLIGLYDLESIRVFTKTGCCSGSANTYRVFVSEEPFSTTTNISMLLNDVAIQNFSIPVIAGNTPSTLNLNLLSRFLRIYLEGDGQMQLVEVEIIGSGNANSSPYQYNWSDSSVSNVTNPDCLSQGLYQVTVMDVTTGCSVIKSINVE